MNSAIDNGTGRSNGGRTPEKRFRVGGVSASVWVYVNRTRGGQEYEQKKVVLERAYRDAQGEWKHTNSYDGNDIPKAILALTKAYEYIYVAPKGDQALRITEESVQ